MTVLSIILASYNRAADLHRLLQAYDRQTILQPFEILVVDNASGDQTREMLRSYQPRHYSLRCEYLGQNLGQGPARNLAIPLATAPLVLFTGDDIVPEVDFVEAHLAAHRRFPTETTAILGRIQWPEDIPTNTVMQHIDGVGGEQFSFYHMTEEQVCDFRYFYTSNLSIKKSFLQACQPWFDPDYSLYGFEDIDLGYRLSRAGLQIRYTSAPTARHYHFHSAYSFARRQYKSGKMAHLFVQKNPELRELIFGQDFLERLEKADKEVNSRLSRTRHVRLPNDFYSPPKKLLEPIERLEVLALRLASFYEYHPNMFMDFFYSQVFEHFFHKGILEQMALEACPGKGGQNTSERQNTSGRQNSSGFYQAIAAQAAFAEPRLKAAINWLLPRIRKYHHPIPEGFASIERV
jgi:GT2 family glycosyltransferase